MSKNGYMLNQLVLDYALVRHTSTECELHYTVTNGLSTDLYLFTPLTELRERGPVSNSQRVYIFWADEKTIHITKRLWSVPKDVDVYMPEMPYLTQVKAGERFEERIRIFSPLTIDFPYRSVFGPSREGRGGGLERQAHRAVFSIGYLQVQKGFPALIPCSDRTGEHFSVSYGSAIENQRMLIGRVVEIQVSVMEKE